MTISEVRLIKASVIDITSKLLLKARVMTLASCPIFCMDSQRRS